MKTTGEHKDEIVAALMKGGMMCQCCQRYAEARRLTIGAGMAKSLMWITRIHQQTNDWVNVQADGNRKVLRNNSHAKLRYWGLIERKPLYGDSTKHHSGIYRPTKSGVSFVEGRSIVPKYRWIYNDECIHVDSSTMIKIRDCFPLKFDFDQLMKNIWGHETDKEG